MDKATIIKVRRGANGFRYAACDESGYFIGNFEKLGDIRKRWKTEIRWGRVRLVRELDKQADMSCIDRTINALDGMLRNYAKSYKSKGAR